MAAREDMLDAAARVMRERGYAHATTKEIARESGYSEALMYKHFRDKAELFVGVLTERLPGLAVLEELPDRVGTSEVRATLVEVARGALAFYVQTFPIAVSVFSSGALLEAHRARIAELGAGGPAHPRRRLAAYLRAEQEGGRVSAGVDPDAGAALLLGACFQGAFLASFEGARAADDEVAAEGLVDTALASWLPG